MVDTTQNNFHSKNQINGNISRSGAIDQESINPHNLCYQCYKYGTYFLFSKLRIRDIKYEPCFPVKNSRE